MSKARNIPAVWAFPTLIGLLTGLKIFLLMAAKRLLTNKSWWPRKSNQIPLIKTAAMAAGNWIFKN